jgi:hypothetical protein
MTSDFPARKSVKPRMAYLPGSVPAGASPWLPCITLPNVSLLKRVSVAKTTLMATTLAITTIKSDAKIKCSILPPESNWFEGAARTIKHLCTGFRLDFQSLWP